MGILSWIVFGLIAGIIAKWIMPGKDPGGFIVTTLIGIAGAVVGGWLGSITGLGGSVSGFSLGSFITAIVGALVLLALYRMVKKGQKPDANDGTVGRKYPVGDGLTPISDLRLTSCARREA